MKNKIYTFKNNVAQWCNSDCKTYTLVILGRLLQTAAIAATLASFVCTFVIGPVALLGLIPSIGAFLLGHCIVQNNKSSSETCPLMSFLECLFPRTFVPGQPVGLKNTGMSCWINSFMQCVIHVPFLREKALRIPEMAGLINEYLRMQNTAVSASEFDWKEFNMHLAGLIAQRGLVVQYAAEMAEVMGGQGDSAALFEWMFDRDPPEPLYTFTQLRTRTNGVQSETIHAHAEMMELDFQLHKSMPALFNHFLDYTNEEDHSRIQKRFDVLPQTLCFHLTRYFGEADPAHRGRWRFHHLADAVEGIDVEYALPREARPNDEEARYACEAFIVHTGQLKGGHYIAYVKNKGVWWRCNDGRITPISEEDAKKEMKRCYIFFMNRQ